MRKVYLLTLVMVFAFAANAFAADKIGVLQSRKIVAECNAGKAAFKSLEKEFSKTVKDMERQKGELTKLREELQKQGMMLSLEARQDKELEYKRKVRDLQDLTQAFQRKKQARESELLAPIFKTVAESVERVGKAQNLAIILDFSSLGRGILYFDETVDVTDAVIADVNKNHK